MNDLLFLVRVVCTIFKGYWLPRLNDLHWHIFASKPKSRMIKWLFVGYVFPYNLISQNILTFIYDTALEQIQERCVGQGGIHGLGLQGLPENKHPPGRYTVSARAKSHSSSLTPWSHCKEKWKLLCNFTPQAHLYCYFMVSVVSPIHTEEHTLKRIVASDLFRFMFFYSYFLHQLPSCILLLLQFHISSLTAESVCFNDKAQNIAIT